MIIETKIHQEYIYEDQYRIRFCFNIKYLMGFWPHKYCPNYTTIKLENNKNNVHITMNFDELKKKIEEMKLK